MTKPLTSGIFIREVSPTAGDVAVLIAQLDQYQIGLYGIEACNLESPASLIKNSAFMLGAYAGNELCGIGSVKFVNDYAEVKRMFVLEKFRGLSIADRILEALLRHVKDQGIANVFLETGNLHHAAVKFYLKNGFEQVESFGSYKPNDVSLYFQKIIAEGE